MFQHTDHPVAYLGPHKGKAGGVEARGVEARGGGGQGGGGQGWWRPGGVEARGGGVQGAKSGHPCFHVARQWKIWRKKLKN